MLLGQVVLSNSLSRIRLTNVRIFKYKPPTSHAMGLLKERVDSKEKVLVTYALPSANGSAHLGHVLGQIYTDIYTRYLKIKGKDVVFVCAADMHGTPITVNAKKAGKDPLEFATEFAQEQLEDYKRFLVDFDNYYSTHSDENKELALVFFNTFKEKGYIYTKEIEQMFDEKMNQFLADRFIKGKCPKCHAEDQYGDVCEKCSATYTPTDLIEPYSTLTKTTPVLKKSTHYYFALSKFHDFLEQWIDDPKNPLQQESKNFVRTWLKDGLQDWCISRDAPYFGFEIPGSLEETGAQKYFYVWLDAPIGYISSTWDYAKKKGKSWEEYWKKGAQPINIIGKDISYFHLIFWQVMLHVMGIEQPVVSVHGFITVDGKKMSKSRGTYFTAKEFYGLYGAESLRFYYAKHLSRTVEDINVNFEDFKATTNNVFMANVGNFCFRTLSFAARNHAEGFESIASGAAEQKLEKTFDELLGVVDESYAEQDIKTALKTILQISDLGNGYFQQVEPWRKRENEEEQKHVDSQVAFCVNLARNISILIKPIVPEFSAKVEKALCLDSMVGEKGNGLHWKDISFEWNSKVRVPEKLVEKIEKLPEKKEAPKTRQQKKQIAPHVFPLEIRVGKIVNVTNHPKADKLYLFKVDFGEEIGTKQVVAGLREFFTAKDLQDKTALFLVNLVPARLRGEISEGMTLTAESPDEAHLSLVHVPDGAKLGTQVVFQGFEQCNDKIEFKILEKYPMVVKEGRVFWNDVVLKVNEKEVFVTDVPDGSRIR